MDKAEEQTGDWHLLMRPKGQAGPPVIVDSDNATVAVIGHGNDTKAKAIADFIIAARSAISPPVLAWCTANPETLAALAGGEMVAVASADVREVAGRDYHAIRYGEAMDRLKANVAKPQENHRDIGRDDTPPRDALGIIYRPAVVEYAESGKSEFVLFDTLTIASDGPGYTILKDEHGTVIGFRWATNTPPRGRVQDQAVDIHAIKVGDKLKLAFPENGYPHEQEKAAAFAGRVLTVKSVDIGGWHTSLTFEEIGGRWNSVQFRQDQAASGEGQEEQLS